MPEKIDFEKLQKAAVEILTLHQAAVGKCGSEQVFSILRKSTSTGYNEMNVSMLIERIEYLADASKDSPGQTAKLGVLDFMIGMLVTGNLAPLIALNKFFNIACHQRRPKNIDPKKASEAISKITGAANKEHTEAINAVLMSLANDGEVDSNEADLVHDEGMDVVNTWLDALDYIDAIRKKL